MNDPPPHPTASPYRLHEDAGAATDWLCQAFGFRERLRWITREPADEASQDL